MSGNLSGVKILVTRPTAVSGPLIETLTSLGGTAISLPLFAIETLFSPEQLRETAAHLSRYDLVICISRNAAEIFLPYINNPAAINWATVGAATADYLQRHGATKLIFPSQPPFDSNSLLSALECSSKALKKQCILILTGADGNSLLADKLMANGESVETAVLYRRTLPNISAELIRDVLNSNQAVDIILITCVTSLTNLLLMTAGTGVNPLKIPILVVSYRIYRHAVELGFVSVLVAAGMSDPDIVTALVSWHN